MSGDDNNKNDGGGGGITYDSPYYLYPSDYPNQLHENRTPHESDAFKAFQRHNGPPGKKGEKNKGKDACVKTETDPIPGLTYEDYQLFLKYFSGTGNSEGTKPVANMAYKEDEEVKGKGDYILPEGTKVNGVLYVPDFKCNLLSVSRLSRDLQCCIS
ncbi:hypothetical protein Tco_0869786, partial [Tanacetum coccineum]